MDGTGRDPARGGRGADYAMPFEAFLEWLRVGARARNDTEWLEWYDGWLRNMPEGDGREGYIERSREEYERRMGETVDEYMDRTWKERLAQLTKENLAELTKENLAECTKRHIEEGTNRQIMVENFKIFQREYVDMTIRRCA